MLRQAEVIVGAQIQHRLAVRHPDGGALRRHDNALVFERAGLLNLLQLLLQVRLQ